MRVAEIKTITLLAPAAYTTSTNGTGVDLQGYESHRAFSIRYDQGAATGTAVSVAVKLQGSNTSTGASDFTDISGATFATVTTTGTNQQTVIVPNNGPVYRYVRAVSTFGTNMTNSTHTVLLMAGTVNV